MFFERLDYFAHTNVLSKVGEVILLAFLLKLMASEDLYLVVQGQSV